MKLNMGLLSAIIGLASSAWGGQKEQSRRTEYLTQGGVRYKRTWSRKYPEQSQRQQMRAFRRQQGGPGIVFDGGSWVPRGTEGWAAK